MDVAIGVYVGVDVDVDVDVDTGVIDMSIAADMPRSGRSVMATGKSGNTSCVSDGDVHVDVDVDVYVGVDVVVGVVGSSCDSCSSDSTNASSADVMDVAVLMGDVMGGGGRCVCDAGRDVRRRVCCVRGLDARGFSLVIGTRA